MVEVRNSGQVSAPELSRHAAAASSPAARGCDPVDAVFLNDARTFSPGNSVLQAVKP